MARKIMDVAECSGPASLDEFRRGRLRAALVRYRELAAKSGRGEVLSEGQYGEVSAAMEELELPASCWAADVSAVRELVDVRAKQEHARQEMEAAAARGPDLLAEVARLEKRVLELRAELRHNTTILPSRYVRCESRQAELLRQRWMVLADEQAAAEQLERRMAEKGQKQVAGVPAGGGVW